jgi:uncharacterized protein (DUF1778 family)
MRLVQPILVNFLEEAKPGLAQLLVRLDRDDLNLINQAAVLLDTQQSVFSRTVLVTVAKKVLKELGGQNGSSSANERA